MFRMMSGRRSGDQIGTVSFSASPHRARRIAPERLAAAKRAFTTRRVDLADAAHVAVDHLPRSGDVLLARIDWVGQHGRLESPHGRRCRLYPGDEILVAYGARYAPDQFEAAIPADLGPCHLVAGGGIAARAASGHAAVAKPTRIVPIGLLADDHGQILNLARYRLPDAPAPARPPHAIVVVGTSMNAGKTTTAASLIRGLTAAGLAVGAAKLTGTGSGGDLWSMIDAGARSALDFTDMGHPSTQALDIDLLEAAAHNLIGHLAAAGSDILVMEIADGLFQRETAALLSRPSLTGRFGGILFAAGDAMGAAHGTQWLRERGLPVLAVSGLVSASPLGAREAERASGVPVVGIRKLADGEFAPRLCFSADAETRAKLSLCG